MPRITAALTLLLLASSALASAQETIATDRPGFAFSPVAVPTGSLQIEVGAPQIARVGVAALDGEGSGLDATSSLLNFPTTLRFGVAPRLELRAFSTLYNRVSLEVEGDNASLEASDGGFGDVELGLKYQVLEASEGVPNLSLIPTVVFPTGADGFTVGDPVINANAAAGFTLPSGFGATLVAGATIPTAEESTVTANLVALVGRSFSSAVSAYVEAAMFPTDGATPVYVGAGLAFLATPTVQLDAFFDAGLNDEAVDLIGGVGISARFSR